MFEEDERREDPLERVTSRARGDVEKLAPAGVFGYAAGKSIIAKKLVKLFPAHKRYTEGFCGSSALYFTKDAVEHEALNDRDPDVAFALNAIKTLSKKELARFEHLDWKGSPQTFKRLKASNPTDKVGRLYKFLYLINFSYGKGRSSFNPGAAGAVSTMHKRVAKFQPRMKHTVITCGDYEKCLKDNNTKDAFHFIDPPYGGYNAGGGGVGEKEFDETRFRKVLDGIKGQFLVTYGTKGKLDTSGFEVKRMRQPRTIRAMRGVGGDQFLTHLLVSNYKVAKADLGEGIDLADVMQVIDTDEGGDRIMVTGSRTSVSVPEQLEPARVWKNDQPLLQYPAEAGPVQGLFRGRLMKGAYELDLTFPVNDTTVGWSLAAARRSFEAPPEELPALAALVAKSFSVEGSRFFGPLTGGVFARETPLEVVAEVVTKIDGPLVELGLQTATSHEYFLSKGDELAGQLLVEPDPLAEPLGEKYPWIATMVSANIVPTVMLKGAPMPPEGVSALPESLEKLVPEPWRYWEHRGAEAVLRRDALIASGFFGPGSLAMVDGEVGKVVSKMALYEPHDEPPAPAAWRVAKVAELVPEGARLVEVSGGLREQLIGAALEKAGEAVVYVDLGATPNVLELLAKAFAEHPGEYVVCAEDSPTVREGLGTLGRVFRFRPGPGVGVDAMKSVFVASFGVRSDEVVWVDKEEGDGAEWLRRGDDVDKAGPHMLIVQKPDGSKTTTEHPSRAAAQRAAAAHLQANGGKGKIALAPKGKEHMVHPVPAQLSSSGKPELATSSSSSSGGGGGGGDQARDDHGRFAGKALLEELEKAGASPRKLLETIGPPHEWSGGVAAALGPENRKAMKEAWEELTPAQKEECDAAFRRNFERKFKVLKADEGKDDEHFVLGIVLEPDEVDAQKDVYSADEVRQAAHRYMAEFQNRGLMHKELVNSEVDILESYLAPADFTIGNQAVKKGTWLMAVRVKNPTLWKAVKGGDLTGFSIGGSANRQVDPKATSKYKARKESTNKKIAFQGIPIVIDRPKGFVQHGVDDQGNAWTREYKTDYGFIPKTQGGDGEDLDVFIGPNEDSAKAFWVTQKTADGTFDEYKVLLGYDTAAAARKTYEDHVPARFFAGIHEGTVQQIKALLNRSPDVKLSEIGKALALIDRADPGRSRPPANGKVLDGASAL